jgi:hypothetical protein
METESFNLPTEDYNHLQKQYPNLGKNGDISKIAIEIVKLYFQTKSTKITFKKAKNGGDIIVCNNEVEIEYEVKGTEDSELAFSKLKVSSQKCHDALKNGMVLIRVTNIRKYNVMLYFLKYGIDFTLHHEPRWKLQQVK